MANEKIEKPKPAEGTPPPQPAPIDKPTAAPAAGAPAEKDKKKVDISGIKTFVAKALDKPAAEKQEKEKPKKEEKPAAKPPAEPAKPAPAAPKPAAATAPPAAKPTPAPAPVSAESIAAATAEAVTRVLGVKPVTPAPQAPAEPQLSAENVRRLRVLERMEKLMPETYKGVAQRYKESVIKLDDYSKKWKAENPGKEFDEADPEHDEFMTQHDVNWTDEDYLEAAADIRAEERLKPMEQKMSEREQEENKQRERSARVAKLKPVILEEQNKAADLYWKGLGDEFDGVIQADGTVNREKLEAIAKADPVAYQVRVAEAERLDVEAQELHLLMNGLKDGRNKPPADNDPEYDAKMAEYSMHRELSDFATRAERHLASQPKESKLDAQGRVFLPYDQFAKVPREQRDAYWTFSASDLVQLRAKDLARKTREKLAGDEEKLSQWAAAKGWVRPDGTPPELPKERIRPAAAPAETLEDEDGKPISPSSGAAPKMAGGKPGGGSEDQSPLNTFVSRALGKR